MSERQETQGIPLPGEPEKAPDFLKDDKWFDVDISGDLLDFEEPYRPPRYTLERNGVKFADVGDLHIITGKPGHGKTGLISQIMAAILSGHFGNTTYCLDERPEPILLYIDTEQGKDDTIAIKNRVCTLAGLPYDKPLKRFVILRLRDTEEASDRWRKILKAIYLIKPTDIFLDGMLDIVKDYNDQVECQPIVRKCMKVATEFDASLWAVLHENPMVDKLVGTLGSIVQRKVSEIFAVRKIKQCDLKPNEQRADMPEIYFQVKQLKARGRDVEDWLFRYEQNAGGWGQPIEIGTTSQTTPTPKAQADSDEEILKVIVKCLLEFMQPPQSDFMTGIVQEFKKRMHVGDTKAKKYFTMANDRGVFHLPINGRYTLNTSECDAILNDLPFAPGTE